MAKRKKTDTVQLKLRIREALRKRLETAARAEEISLNSEMGRRLEQSFLQNQSWLLVETLLARGPGLELLMAIATVLRQAGPNWHRSPSVANAVADAVNKVVAVLIGELPPVEDAFPERNDETSSDHLAWMAVLVGRFHAASENDIRGAETPAARLARIVVARSAPKPATADERAAARSDLGQPENTGAKDND
jgi:hypothetical protein